MRCPVRLSRAARSTLLALTLAVVPLALPSAAAAENQDPVAQEATRYLDGRIADLSTRTGPDDHLYFADGAWQVGDAGCSRCLLGPSVVTAVLASRGVADADQMRVLTRQSVDEFLTHQHADGGWADTPTGPSDGVPTEFIGQQLGTIVLLMADQLDAPTRGRWQDALVRTARFLLNHGDAQWYSNGNINLGYTLTLGLAARVSGDPALLAAYETSWSFTLAPGGIRFAAFGVRYATPATREDAADGAGYLVENGTGGAGFDAHYTQLQADIATRMWLTLGDPRALRLVNLTTNMLRPRVNASWTLDTSYGSRHPGGGYSFPYITAGAAASAACRNDLDGRSRSQLSALETWFDRNLDQTSLYDNDDWAFYLGESAANFALLGDAPPCGAAGTWPSPGAVAAAAAATAPAAPAAPAARVPAVAAPAAGTTAGRATPAGPHHAATGGAVTRAEGTRGGAASKPAAKSTAKAKAKAKAKARAKAKAKTRAKAKAKTRAKAKSRAKAKAKTRAKARKARAKKARARSRSRAHHRRTGH
jgi:hypothetical protein